MLCQKEKCFQARIVSLERLVPANHFYRQLEAKLDLHFVYALVKDTYAPKLGRPSIDPVVFFKLQLIMFFEGIRSERQLMEMVNVNLAHRWYIGYDLDEAVPNHSSLSKIRARYGLAVFHQFFEKVVELCLEAGMVWGKELYFDGSKVRANADIDKLVPRWYWKANQHAQSLFASAAATEDPPSVDAAGRASGPSAHGRTWLVEKYREPQPNEKRKSSYVRTSDLLVSPTDPDATPMRHFPGDHATLGYHTHYVVDGGRTRIILAALVTPAAVMDNTPMLDLARWVRFRWKLKPKIAVGDTKYGTIANIVGLERDGIRAYLPMTDFSEKTGLFPAEQFQYDAARDLFVCPQGQELKRYARRKREQVILYRAQPNICNHCPVKTQCTDSQRGRHIFRSFFQEEIDCVRAYQETAAYQKALRKRQVWVEPLFGEAKQWHQRARFRLRRLHKVNIEGLLTAAGQNLKRLMKWGHGRSTSAAGAAVAVVQFLFIFLEKALQTSIRQPLTFSTR